MTRRTLLLTPFALSAAPPPAQVHQHGRFETSWSAGSAPADPLQVELFVHFSGPGGAAAKIPGFWDGDSTWKVRFSPEKTGRWTWRTVCSEPSLDGKSGSFEVKRYTGSNPLYRRGAPRVSPDRRHFVQADGTPWFWLACTGWNSALMSTDEEWDRYLADRAAKKFTAIQFVMTQWRAGRKDELGQTAFTVDGSLRIHPEFFRRLDGKFDKLNDAGLVGVPVLLWALTSADKESPGATLATDQAIRLARYMVARYGAHHVLWFLGGDGNYEKEHAERWKTIGRAVFPPDEPRRPVSLHPGGMRNPWPEYLHEPWLDFLAYQTGHGSDARKWKWNATEGGASGWKLEPPRPVLDAEPNYEGHLSYQARAVIGDAEVRRAVYYDLLSAPPAGVTYGAHGIWFWSRKAEVPLDHPRTGVALPWFECLNYPGAKQMKVMRDIFDSIEWWRLRPDRTLLAEDPPDPTYLAYPMPARSNNQRFALIYLPANPKVSLNLEGFKATVQGQWIDPRTGERKPAGKWKPAGRVDISTPGPEDWLLLLS